MFDFDGAKLLLIGIVMLIVIKPKDLPGVMRQVGQTIAQLRRMAAEFQGQFAEAMREAELHELKKDVEKMTRGDLDGLNPFDSIRSELATTKADIEGKLNAPASAAAAGLPSHPSLSELASPPAGDGPTAEEAAVIAETAASPHRPAQDQPASSAPEHATAATVDGPERTIAR